MHLDCNKNALGLGEIERRILDTMTQLGKLFIQYSDVEAVLKCDKRRAHVMLSRLHQKGWLQKIKRGVYRIVPLGSGSTNPTAEDAWAIATALFAPCYISGWTAAEHWGLTDQIFNTTLVYTTQKQRKKEQIIAGLNFRIQLVLPEYIFGTEKIWSSNVPVLLADRQRTLIDILQDPELGGGARHVVDIFKNYLQQKEAKPEMLVRYAEKLGHGGVFKRLGFLAEKFALLPGTELEKLRLKIKRGIINFDPQGAVSGPIITKWGLRINIPLEDIS